MNGARVGGAANNYTFRPAINTNMITMKHVLIVDDEADICLLLSGLLSRLGYQPTCANYLEEGRQCLRRQRFDAVFLDLNLPDGIGFDLLPIIKTGLSIAESPKVVMISAFDGMAERKRASDQGADYFMGKPFTRKTVEQALESIQL
ncbi:MAG TPA: response regulator [Fibrella sp.]|jgi:DNA-binding response OmpR family regulator